MLQFQDEELQAAVAEIIKRETAIGISTNLKERESVLWDLIVGNMLDEELVFKLRSHLVQLVISNVTVVK